VYGSIVLPVVSCECQSLTSGFKVREKKWLRTAFLSKRDEMIGTGEKVRNTSVVIDILYRMLLRLLI
jgi:hypothetical protein